MIVRKPPDPVRFQRDPLWERTQRFERLANKMRDDPDIGFPVDLTESQRVALEATVASHRWPSVTKEAYRLELERARNGIRPLVVAPLSDAPTRDVIAAWRQPEAVELWQRIMSGLVVNRRSAPSLHFALGVMLVLGGMRATPHVLHAHDLLLNNRRLSKLVSELAFSCEGALQCEPRPTSYAQVTRYLPRLSEALAAEAHITLAQIAAAFSGYGIPVGRHLAVDGSLMPAWAQQRPAYVNGKWDPALEARLRRRAPEAGFVAYSGYDRELDAQAQARGESVYARGRAIRAVRIRGYRLTALVDIATGIALAFDVSDATDSHEPRILRDVLAPTLFDLSPTIDVSAIVGDGAYDDNPTHEHFERLYGIHLVTARRARALSRRGKLFREIDHPSVAAVEGDGIAICRAHGLRLPYAGLDAPRRTALRPGEATPASAFRSRFVCSDGCGKISVPTRACWSNLPYFPHTPYARLRLYAQRRALLDQRNQVEAAFSSLQVGYKQCLDGSARVRSFDREVVEALIALALVTRALLALRAERLSRGELV